MAPEPFTEEQAAVVGPGVDKLINMIGAARDAFNRHSRASLEAFQTLAVQATQEFSTISNQLNPLVAQAPEAQRPAFLQFFSILNCLEIIGQNLGELGQPIEKKIKGGVLFSDKAVTQTNYLFDQHTGMIRSILDIVKTNNDFLKKFVLAESRKLVQACADFATEHEDRLIEGLCLPQAAPIFLAILENFRAIGEREMEVANLMAPKP
jgi:Na+/phosphate symporter